MNDAQRRFECIRIWLEAKEGRATEQELRQLNDILETDPGARRAIVELTQQQGWFAWHGMSAPGLALSAIDEAMLPPPKCNRAFAKSPMLGVTVEHREAILVRCNSPRFAS